jgi:hypothetical protein
MPPAAPSQGAMSAEPGSPATGDTRASQGWQESGEPQLPPPPALDQSPSPKFLKKKKSSLFALGSGGASRLPAYVLAVGSRGEKASHSPLALSNYNITPDRELFDIDSEDFDTYILSELKVHPPRREFKSLDV